MTLRSLVFVLGFALPFISFDTRPGITRTLLSRIEIADVVCLLTVAALFVAGRLRTPWPLWFYGIALVLSLAMGTGGDSLLNSFTAFAAVAMAALYYCVAASIAPSEILVRAFLAGLLGSTFIESVIVVHDFFLPKWFPASHDARARGTFRTTAQLGNFGFCAAGMLLSFGWVYLRGARNRFLVVLAACLAIFFVFASSRRAAMFGLLAWLGAYLLLGLRRFSRKAYLSVMVLTLAGLTVVIAASSLLSTTHVGERFMAAFEHATSGNSYTHIQLYNAIDEMHQWFPLGIGAGQGFMAVKTGEVHNAHLAVLVELGLLGLVGYYSLWWPLVRRKWGQSFGGNTQLVKLVVVSFVIAAAVFMIHARLDRDRIFMLYLGLAPTVACAAAQPARPRIGYDYSNPRAQA